MLVSRTLAVLLALCWGGDALLFPSQWGAVHITADNIRRDLDDQPALNELQCANAAAAKGHFFYCYKSMTVT